MNRLDYTAADFAISPYLVFYEVTRACDLACRHCRASAQPLRSPEELNGELARGLIESLTEFPKPPLLVFTGGDPLKRPDLPELIRYATGLGLRTALTPSATPLATREALATLRACGLKSLALSLDGATPATHDALRGVLGSFEQTMRIAGDARSLGFTLQINTTVTGRNEGEVRALADRISRLGVWMWSVFFLVPVGRGMEEERIAPEDYESVFERLFEISLGQPFAIKTTEAPHYRRFLLQKRMEAEAACATRQPFRETLGLNDGKGVLFVDHQGYIAPSGFLPIRCGRFPSDSPVNVYRQHPLFQALRDPTRLKAKCGACEFRGICGGSRARAYAVTGDPLAAEPDCVYRPPLWLEK